MAAIHYCSFVITPKQHEYVRQERHQSEFIRIFDSFLWFNSYKKLHERDKSKLSLRHFCCFLTLRLEFFQLITKWHKNWINLILLYCILKSSFYPCLTARKTIPVLDIHTHEWINLKTLLNKSELHYVVCTNLVGIQYKI